jgi:signal transduction histidine kinase
VKRPAASIQGRLTVRLGTLFAIVFVAASLMVFFRYREGGGEPPSEALTEQIYKVAAALQRDSSGNVRLTLPPNATRRFDYVIRNASGRVLVVSSEAELQRMGLPPAGWDQGSFQDFEGPNGEMLFGAFVRLQTDVGLVTIQVAEVDSVISAQAKGIVDQLIEDVVPILLPFVLATLGIGLLTIRRSLAPLTKLAQQAENITPAALELRLPDTDLPRELRPLVAAINGALDRLDAGFRQQREFTADAAHELRTPLAILAAHLDSLGDQQPVRALREDVDRMSRLVGQLLSVARLEALAISPNEFADLHAIAVEVAGSLAPWAVRQGKAVAVTGVSDAIMVHGNADALTQAVRNLAENALQHTPIGTSVDIEVTAKPAVHVIDQGPGIPEAMRMQVTKRFWRGDHRKGRDDGVGLGLAIVTRIATAHGAKLEVTDAPSGGARFSLYLHTRKKLNDT